jgi:hypothetical protein
MKDSRQNRARCFQPTDQLEERPINDGRSVSFLTEQNLSSRQRMTWASSAELPERRFS